ncbi:YbaB/EbfC family nucleoid-associated protein [Nonomuraea sp. NPDC048916]|uniref:YbaB/EbfC family nucleoid-associated protein n=1 Tax=Nonomuraea sp. NPDC048916 TaxID=3154232 RepID=UPI0034032D11
MVLRDGSSGDPDLDRLMAEFKANSRELSDVMEQVGEVRGQATSADDKIRVQVSSSGQLTSLRIDPRAMKLGSQELADAIMDAARRATEDAARRLMDVTRPYLGDDRQGDQPRRR